MRLEYAILQRIENDRTITKETDDTFRYHLEQAVLLALREQGILGVMQYRQADENLKARLRKRAQGLQERR